MEMEPGHGVEDDVGVRQRTGMGDTVDAAEGATEGGRGAEGRRLERKRKGRQVARDNGDEWQSCAVGDYRVDRVKLVAGVRVIRLAEVVAGRRRTEKRSRRAECNRHRLKVAVACVGGCCRLKFELDNFDERGLECGSSSAGAESGLSGEEGDRQWIVRRQEEKRVAVAESRRGYAIGAAWDEGNMIQAMARLKNPTIAWRYGDG